MDLVVDGGREGGLEAVVGVEGKVDDDLGFRRDSRGDLDIEHDLAVGTVVGTGQICADAAIAFDANRNDLGHRDSSPAKYARRSRSV